MPLFVFPLPTPVVAQVTSHGQVATPVSQINGAAGKQGLPPPLGAALGKQEDTPTRFQHLAVKYKTNLGRSRANRMFSMCDHSSVEKIGFTPDTQNRMSVATDQTAIQYRPLQITRAGKQGALLWNPRTLQTPLSAAMRDSARLNTLNTLPPLFPMITAGWAPHLAILATSAEKTATAQAAAKELGDEIWDAYYIQGMEMEFGTEEILRGYLIDKVGATDDGSTLIIRYHSSSEVQPVIHGTCTIHLGDLDAERMKREPQGITLHPDGYKDPTTGISGNFPEPVVYLFSKSGRKAVTLSETDGTQPITRNTDRLYFLGKNNPNIKVLLWRLTEAIHANQSKQAPPPTKRKKRH